MVTTRKSLPSNEAVVCEPKSPSHLSKKQQAALRKLRIDAKDTIVTGKAAQQEGDKIVYHWRGSTYEITGKEPTEWIEQQPKKYKERPSLLSQTPDDEGAILGAQEGVKRKRSVSDAQMDTQSPVKKTKKSLPASGKAKNKAKPIVRRTRKGYEVEPEEEEEEEAEEEEDRTYSSRVFDYTRVGGQEERSCAQAARDLAAKRGYNVQALPQTLLDRTRGRMTAGKVVSLAKLNGEMDKLRAHYKQLRQEMLAFSMPATIPPAAAKAPLQTPAEYDSTPDVTDSTGGLTMREQNTSETSSDDVILTRVVPRADSATEGAQLGSPFDTTKPLTVSTPLNVTPERILPAMARGGQHMRWSIKQEDVMSTEGKAEEAIQRGRMEGESKAARRRRVQRETEMVRSWGLVEDELLREEDARMMEG